MRSEHSACLDEQLEVNWSERLQPIAERLNPLHAEIFRNFEAQYYWSSFQCEWATDVLLRPGTLERLEPLLLRHGLLHFSPPDILRFFGRAHPLGGHGAGAFFRGDHDQPESTHIGRTAQALVAR